MWLGKQFGGESGPLSKALRKGIEVSDAYELQLNAALLEGLSSVPGLHIRGITDPHKMGQRVPTFSFTLEGWNPLAVAEKLAQEHINVCDGNYYALEVMKRLGLEDHGGMVRVGLTHYNTFSEIEKLVSALQILKR